MQKVGLCNPSVEGEKNRFSVHPSVTISTSWTLESWFPWTLDSHRPALMLGVPVRMGRKAKPCLPFPFTELCLQKRGDSPPPSFLFLSSLWIICEQCSNGQKQLRREQVTKTCIQTCLLLKKCFIEPNSCIFYELTILKFSPALSVTTTL